MRNEAEIFVYVYSEVSMFALKFNPFIVYIDSWHSFSMEGAFDEYCLGFVDGYL